MCTLFSLPSTCRCGLLRCRFLYYSWWVSQSQDLSSSIWASAEVIAEYTWQRLYLLVKIAAWSAVVNESRCYYLSKESAVRIKFYSALKSVKFLRSQSQPLKDGIDSCLDGCYLIYYPFLFGWAQLADYHHLANRLNSDVEKSDLAWATKFSQRAFCLIVFSRVNSNTQCPPMKCQHLQLFHHRYFQHKD